MPEEHTKDLYRVMDIKRIEGSGMLVYYDGALYPARGFPTDKIFSAVRFVKRTLIESLKFPLIFLYSNKKLVRSFNQLAKISIGEAIQPGYLLCPAAAKIEKIVYTFLIEIGIEQQEAIDCAMYIAYIFEHDNAYRYRVQDLATAAFELNLKTNPRKEIRRLMKLFMERDDNPVVVHKFKMFYGIISLGLLLPKYKKAFQKSIAHGLDGLRYDREDWYWVCHRTDYLYGGLSHEKRYREFDIHPRLYSLEELKSKV